MFNITWTLSTKKEKKKTLHGLLNPSHIKMTNARKGGYYHLGSKLGIWFLKFI